MLYSLEEQNTDTKKKTEEITSNNKTCLVKQHMRQKFFEKN